jgi:hypothetical protein
MPDDPWDEIELTYAILETRRDQLILAKRLSEAKLETADEAEAFKLSSDKLGRLRRKLVHAAAGRTRCVLRKWEPTVNQHSSNVERLRFSQ